MIFLPTKLKGAYFIDIEKHQDERGFFARTWCESEFLANGLNAKLKQCNISVNQKKGTLRGMHYQADPHGEVKLVRCTKGSIYDVIVDLRTGSPTYKHYIGVELSEENRRMLYVPEGLAHGFQTLTDDAEVFYQMASEYVPSAAMGVRWNDPTFAIEWPAIEKRIISPRDEEYLDFVG